MKRILEDEGIELLKDAGRYFLQYDAGAHMVKKKRISITADEAELCQLDVDEMYNIILQYQNDGIYGEDIVYYGTTKKEVRAGETVYSDSFVIPDRSSISEVVCGIHKVLYSDDKSVTVNDVDYCTWTID